MRNNVYLKAKDNNMDVFQIILLINLCISVGYFIASMIILKLSGINPIGKKVNNKNAEVTVIPFIGIPLPFATRQIISSATCNSPPPSQ